MRERHDESHRYDHQIVHPGLLRAEHVVGMTFDALDDVVFTASVVDAAGGHAELLRGLVHQAAHTMRRAQHVPVADECAAANVHAVIP